MAKTIFITGASRGLGRIWAEAFLKRGDQVIAAIRDPQILEELSSHYESTLLVLPLDVTDKAACFDAIVQATSHFGTIDVLINNAGYGHLGAIEELEEGEIRAQFETNVYGSLWMTQAVIPVMREQRSGHIIQVSSMFGVISIPTAGLYSASKYAVEGIADALALEVSGFGIHVSLVEPNGFTTEFATSSSVSSKPLRHYDDIRASLVQGNKPEHWGLPEATAEAILKLVDAENPPLRLILGSAGYPLIKQIYEQRLKTWEDWQDVSVKAQGK